MLLLETAAFFSGVSFLSLLPVIMGFILGYIVIEQYWVYKAAQGLPGPKWVPPFLGNMFQMIYDPFGFWDGQDKMGPCSWNSIVGTFMIFCQETSLSRTVMKNAANNKLKIVLNLNGERLLGKDNIAFMQGPAHKILRQQLVHLFTKKALAKYVHIQEDFIRRSIDNWLQQAAQQKGPIEMRPLIRDLNLETSQTVFVGPYLDEELRKQFCDDYNTMNNGLLSLPWAFPGSTLWYGIRARKRVVAMLGSLVAKSKEQMRKAREDSSIQQECLLDFWMMGTNKRLDEWEEAKKASEDPDSIPPPEHSHDDEIGSTVLDFLFASQDASSASLTWVCHYLAKHPEYLAKIRDEQEKLRPNDEPIDLINLNQMTYTKQVVKEVLRYRAPATLVPHMALENFKLTEEITVPKGTLVIPSVFSSSFQGFPDPYTFDPERFGPERKEDVKYSSNYLVFGAGPHRCIGMEYAMFHLLAFTALFATHVDFERVWTPKSEEIVYGPTIYPGDGCLLNISPRKVK